MLTNRETDKCTPTGSLCVKPERKKQPGNILVGIKVTDRRAEGLLKPASKYKRHTTAAYTHGDPLKNVHFHVIAQPPKKRTTTTEEAPTF